MVGPDDAFPKTRPYTSTAERRIRAGLQKKQDRKPQGIRIRIAYNKHIGLIRTSFTGSSRPRREDKIIHSQKKSMEECETMGLLLLTKCTTEGGRNKLLWQNKSMNCNEKSQQQRERRCNICGHCQRRRNMSSEDSSDMERSVGRSQNRMQRTEQSTKTSV